MGKAIKLLTGEVIRGEKAVKRLEKAIRRRAKFRYARIERHTGRSGDETLEKEPERISSYISEDINRKILFERAKKGGKLSDETTEEAVDYLMELPGFDKLFENVSDESIENFKEWIKKNYLPVKWKDLRERWITLKSGLKVHGIFIEPKKTYVIPVEVLGKKYFQIRDYETGRIVGRSPAVEE